MSLRMKQLGIAAIGVLLIFFGLIVTVTPLEVGCLYCGGEGKTDCPLCANGTEKCFYCDGAGWEDCTFCEDGRDDCTMCANGTCYECGGTGGEFDACWSCDGTGKCDYCNGQGWETCTFCNGEGGESCADCGGDGLVECTYCNGQGGDPCTLCDGEGRLKVGSLLMLGSIPLIPAAFMLMGILFIPIGLLVGREAAKPPRICPQCGRTPPPDVKFCPYCGKTLGANNLAK